MTIELGNVHIRYVFHKDTVQLTSVSLSYQLFDRKKTELLLC